MLDFWINGVSARSKGIYTESITPPSRPSRRYAKTAVPGRDGFLLTGDSSFNEVVRTVTLFVDDADRLSDVYAFLDGAENIRFSNDAGHLLKCCQMDQLDPEEFTAETCSMTVAFTCQPYRYIYPEAQSNINGTGEALTASINNAGNCESCPYIQVKCTAATEVSVNGYRIVLYNTGITVIDCENMTITKSAGELAGTRCDLPDGFPKLSPGANEIVLSAATSWVRIKRRERDL